jgi:catechol 2,3-dioxygenase-like lactoylglutathione lyase family enzyme
MHMMQRPARLEQSDGAFVAEIVKMQIERERFGLQVIEMTQDQRSEGNNSAMPRNSSRRTFVKTIVTAAAARTGSGVQAQQPGSVRGFDHVALPMRNTGAMVTFYRNLGFQTSETANAVSVHIGEQMINFHRPAHWQDPTFTLRAPAARPPCGDLCFVWDGTAVSLKVMLDRAGAKVVEGPVDRQGGRRKTGSSVYVRDPDGNLLEFMIYS